MALTEQEFAEFLGVVDAPQLVRRIAGGAATVGDARDVFYLMLSLHFALKHVPSSLRSCPPFVYGQQVLDREAEASPRTLG